MTVNVSMSMSVDYNLSACSVLEGVELECCWWHAVGLRVHLSRCVWNACRS